MVLKSSLVADRYLALLIGTPFSFAIPRISLADAVASMHGWDRSVRQLDESQGIFYFVILDI